jgi:GTPase Era involved in 16S rRNA processing
LESKSREATTTTVTVTKEQQHQLLQQDQQQQTLMIVQDLIVATKSHQRLVLGRGGQTLQRIQSSAVPDLERAFGCHVVLQLRVKHVKYNQERSNIAEWEGAHSTTDFDQFL